MDAHNSTRELLALLDLEPIGPDAYRGYSRCKNARVYGGQVVGQALVAAQRSVPADRPAHSLHAYFILAGDPREPIDFFVTRLRDGKSFTTRRCEAKQRGRTIFSMEASFHIEEPGLEHALPAPEAPAPETLPTKNALAERFADFLPLAASECIAGSPSVDIRVVDPSAFFLNNAEADARQFIWFKIAERIGDEIAVHQALLAYLSDMTLLNTALARHGRSIFDERLQVASLDHAVWFHRPFRADEWLLYTQDSPTAAGARTLTRGMIFSSDGRLVASVAQEGLIRDHSSETRAAD
ncbi:(3S)-malyl-CoA thioesterase [Methylosinus sp. sav-2]|uniref:acyl-CoA thioesterase n=1 Tax=Methylosinus sp. sav-2 TaxID=2485168 RepID=UPI00047B347A|nr:acyl-CoA thioesterase II [Methylosinus sp. sav-2]TDX63110.1 (3S)-malyl-CoA thioesterase [Methylosinus sp. sav-2]